MYDYTISVPIILRNAIKLKYPVDRVVRSCIGLADEILISVDPTSEDDSVDFVHDLMLEINLVTKRDLVRYIEVPWNIQNISGGNELARQTDIAIEHSFGDFVFCIQADEAVNSSHFSILRDEIAKLQKESLDALSMTRLYFYGGLKTIRVDWTLPIVRFFRRGTRKSVGDAFNTIGDDKKVVPSKVPIYHYSRIGDPELLSRRIRNLDSFYHNSVELLSEVELQPYDFSTYNFDCMHRANVDVGRREVNEEVLIPFYGKHPASFEDFKG